MANDRPNLTDITILFFIREVPASGYDIRKMIEHDRVKRWLQVSVATIYAALRRLHRDGYVSASTDQQGRYPQRQVYTITPSGIRLHDQTAAELLADGDRDSLAFRIGLTGGAFVPPKLREQALKTRRDRLRQRRDELQNYIDHYSELTGMAFPEWIHVAREIDMLDGELAWLDKFIARHGKTWR